MPTLAGWAARLGFVPVLALFFGFVGFMKAWAPMAELARHHAWVTSLPEPLARAVGVSEVLCAIGLLGAPFPGRPRRAARLCAWSLVANQCAALAFHLGRAEGMHPLVQNVILIGLLASVGWASTNGPGRAPARH